MLAGDGLVGEYFDEIDLTSPTTTLIDATVNFPSDALGDDALGRVVADDNYSIRWTGWVQAEQAGEWDFATISNDGVRLWVDDQQIIDNWTQHAATRDEGSVTLAAGWHPIRLEYYQQNGGTDMQLLFSGPGQSETIIPQARLSTIDPDQVEPLVDAGPDQVVRLPATEATLTGSATDNGQIVAYQWTQLSGPNTAVLSGADTPELTASGLVEGTYTFELVATDDEQFTGSDTATVTIAEESEAVITGELQRWHKTTLDFTGPSTSETAVVNPFLDYRLDVTFSHAGSGKSYLVPGYYAADGNAANTSASSGDVWRVHFAPDEIGEWTYVASFRSGSNVAVANSPSAGASGGFFDGASGSFVITETDKTGRDFRGKGRLEYVGERYLQFAGTGEYFLKQGADSPENLLAYDEFDGPFASDGQQDNLVKNWAPHVADWNPGDPTWGNDQGKGLIGAINYLASEGMNAFSFLPMNIAGDDRNVFPYLDYNERLRMDVSRLAQWEVVFEHADTLGMFLHFKTQETENDQLLDGGNLGTQRTLYYRELIARFSHHLGLNWNLGEEITNTTAQIQDFAQYFRDNDPYDHHIVAHTFAPQQDQRYGPLLGDASELTGASVQTNQPDFRNVHGDAARWVRMSEEAGKPWAVAVDEPGDARNAIRPDSDPGNSHEDGRKNALWGTLMAGGWGNEYYFGYDFADSDLTLQDFRSRDDWWDYARYALDFFEDNDIPFWAMQNDNEISSAANDYGFYQEGGVYTVYLKDGGTTNLDLSNVSGTYDVRWFDPRNGGALQTGSVSTVFGGGEANLGVAPNSTSQDWAILVTRQASAGPNQPPAVSIPGAEEVVLDGDVFQEQGGLVVFEIESQPPTGSWEAQTSVPGFTGDSYYRWEGNNLFNQPGAQGLIEYKINITNPGTYQLRFHNRRDADIAQDAENDVWARMDNGEWAKVFTTGNLGQWNWVSRFDFGEGNRPNASYELEAGEHSFFISGRSNGFRIDRVALYNTDLVSASVAENLSTPQSPTDEVSAGLTFDLTGQVLDDGQVNLAPQLQWSLTSGPGEAVFSNPANSSTRVTFSQPGVYRVTLTADDGEFTSTASRVIIAPPLAAPAGDVSFSPIDDATVEGSSGQNNDVIKVQSSTPVRTGYLKFDVSDIGDAEVVGATLRLTVSQDAGSGVLNLRQGGSNNWTEETLNSGNAPAAGAIIDSASGSFTLGSVVEFDVSSLVTDAGVYTFVLEQASGNDVWFSSKEGDAAPELIVMRPAGSSAGDYNVDTVVDDADRTFWTLSFGTNVGDGLQADGNQDGVVSAADYSIWRGLRTAPIAATVAATTFQAASPQDLDPTPAESTPVPWLFAAADPDGGQARDPEGEASASLSQSDVGDALLLYLSEQRVAREWPGDDGRAERQLPVGIDEQAIDAAIQKSLSDGEEHALQAGAAVPWND